MSSTTGQGEKMTRENHLINALRRPTANTLDRVFAHLPDGKEISFGMFFSQARRIAAGLRALGVRPGDRVALQVEKSIDALKTYVGVVEAGAVLLPLNTAYTATELEYFLADAQPRVLICDPERYDSLLNSAQKACVGHVLTLDAQGGGSFWSQMGHTNEGFDAVARGENDLAAILYTSGTTGRSKGAMLSHGNLVSNSRTLCDLWQFSNKDILIHALPIFHTHGLFVATNVALMAGAQIILQPRFSACDIVGAMPKATSLMGVPTFYTRLLAEPTLAKAAENMRLFISGSAPLLAETHQQWQQITGQAILERYGMTETNMTTSNPYNGARRAGTVGMPLPGIEVKITDVKTGETVADGQPGILEVRGPNVFQGYWNMAQKTAEELRTDGYFITGDIAQQSHDGYITIVGRQKDLIISGGFNIYPKEVELLIDDIAGVLESAVIGVPHSDFGEAVVAVVVATGTPVIGKADVTDAIAPLLAKFKQPKRVIFVPELPRNTMGKVQKVALRNRYKNLFNL